MQPYQLVLEHSAIYIIGNTKYVQALPFHCSTTSKDTHSQNSAITIIQVKRWTTFLSRRPV